jgi:hypothetical protein
MIPRPSRQRRRLCRFALAAALLLALVAPLAALSAQPADEAPEVSYARAHYAKFEYRIPMRDGTRLFTAVYVPNDSSQPYPFLMVRTPYGVGPYGADRYKRVLGPNEEFDKAGFIFVFQDVRGRHLSEGEFVNMRPHQANKSGPQDVDESTDTYDTVEWLLAHVANHNGKVGQWGISYPGFYTAAGMIDSHPALAAVSPQAPIADWFWDDMHHNGAFILPLAFNFFSTFGQAREGLTTTDPDRFEHGTPDGYQFFLDLGPLANANQEYFHGEIDFWNQIVAHPNYDEFWQSRNLLPHLKNIGAAVLTVGGWFDTEDLYGPLKIYREVERNNPGIESSLVMGPWPHGGWRRSDGDQLGEAEFGFKTSEFYRSEIELPFFLHHLKGAAAPKLAEATVFETGANRWRRFDAWPPQAAERRALYLRKGGALAFEPPETPSAPGAAAFDEYPSDPAKPVPYTMEITTRWARNYMTEDQRFAAWRPDVLVYQTEPLEQDLTLAGPARVDLRVATTGTDADFVVKVIDVYPGEWPDWDEDEGDYPGAVQRLVRADVFRGRFRDSFEVPKPFVPGEVASVRFELLDFFHTFQRGHRLMVQVQSSWFPFVDRNPQTFVENLFEARPEDFVKATHRVYHSAEQPSSIEIGVLPSP